MEHKVKILLWSLITKACDNLNPPAISHDVERAAGGAVKTNELAEAIFCMTPEERGSLGKWGLLNFKVALGNLARDKTTQQMGMVRFVGANKSNEPWDMWQWISVDMTVGDDARDI